MMPQFAQPENYRFKAENLSVGMMLFVIGLAKKVLLADGIAPYADAGFAAPGELMFWGSWGASLCTRCSCTSTSPATRTWRWAWPRCSASASR